METPNVNNLNGVPNFGHGLPEDGIVQAGVTDTPKVLSEEQQDNGEETAQEDVQGTEGQEESQSDIQRGDESDELNV